MHIPVASHDVHLMYEQSMQNCSYILSCTYDALQVEVHVHYIIKCENDARAYKLHHCMYILCTSIMHAPDATSYCIPRCASDARPTRCTFVIHQQMHLWCTCIQTASLHVHFMYLHYACTWCNISLHTTMCFWCTSNTMHIRHSSADASLMHAHTNCITACTFYVPPLCISKQTALITAFTTPGYALFYRIQSHSLCSNNL